MHAFYGVRPAAPDTPKYPPLPSWAAALTPKSTKTKTSTNTKAATATRVKSRESGIAKVKLLRNTTPKAARRAVLKTANTVRAVARSQPKVASRIGTVAKSLAKTVRTVAKSQAQVTNRVLPRLQQLRARVQAKTLAQAYPTAVVTNAAMARSQIRGPDHSQWLGSARLGSAFLPCRGGRDGVSTSPLRMDELTKRGGSVVPV